MPLVLGHVVRRDPDSSWAVRFANGAERHNGDTPPAFTLCVADQPALDRLRATDAYSAAMAYVRGEFDVDGDLYAAIRWKGPSAKSLLRGGLVDAVARCATAMQSAFQTRAQTARHIRFHYDRSNEFYRLFLDPRMVYSCAYFRKPEMDLAEAQLAKLDHICRKLDLAPGDRFLDIGCGWGALIGHAADHYGVEATGCTLSLEQFEHASRNERVQVLERDYRDLAGCFDKIASVGMFEHVGRRRAPQYFAKMAELLEPGGLFLNHAIARPQKVGDDASSLFVRRRIFPGGELIHVGETIRFAEEAGFEVLDVENLRPHYARTCRLWEQRLMAHREEALQLVDDRTFRAWRIWLAASSLSFEEGSSSIYQLLMAKQGTPRRKWTRDYMYR